MQAAKTNNFLTYTQTIHTSLHLFLGDLWAIPVIKDNSPDVIYVLLWGVYL